MKNRIFTLAIASVISIAAMAQFEGTTPDERIAATAGEDSISVGRGHISMFQMSLHRDNGAGTPAGWSAYQKGHTSLSLRIRYIGNPCRCRQWSSLGIELLSYRYFLFRITIRSYKRINFPSSSI